MSVLILDDDKVERAAMAQILAGGDHRVVQASDVRGALAAQASDPPEIVVMAWPRVGGADIIKRLRVGDRGSHTYVIAVLDTHPATDIEALFAAGADDFMRRPLSREEVLGRVAAPQRIRRWATARASAAPAPLPFDLRHFEGYRRLGSLIASELEGVVGHSFDEVAEGWSPNHEVEVSAASISMALATERTELRISILVGARSLRSLATSLLGDPHADVAVLEDILREMANSSGGAVKRALLRDNIVLTTGIPITQRPAQALSEHASCWTATIRSLAVKIGIVGEIHRTENKLLPAAELEEGMVVARDLRNASGALLVPAGTRLTLTTATRIANLFGPRFVVEVVAAA